MLLSSFSFCHVSKLKSLTSILCIQFLLLSPILSGQASLRFNHLSSDDGLTSNTTTCLLKDSQGFLWIGTDAGLNRFDGNKVTKYEHIIGDPTSLVNNGVITLFEDTRQRIWIGTDGGLSIFDSDSNKFVNFRTVHTPGDTINFRDGIRAIREFKNKIWIATNSEIVTCPLNSYAFALTSKFKSQDRVPYYFLDNQTAITSSGIWFLSSKGPVYTEDGSNFIYCYHNPDHWPIINQKWYASIFSDCDSIIYFTTFHYRGIYVYRPFAQTLDSIPFTNALEASGIWIRSLSRLNENELMGVSDNNGAFTLNTKSRTSKFYIPDNTNPNSIGSSHGEQIVVDNQKIIYLATDQGLDYVSSSQQPFTVFNTLRTGIGNMKVCIAEDDAGHLWFGTLKKGLFRYTPATGGIIQFEFPDTYNEIWSIYYANNQLLLGTKGGLATFSTISKKFKSLQHEVPKEVQDLTDGPTARFFIKDNSGSFWIVLFPYGLLKYNFDSKEYIHYSPLDSVYHLPGKGTITAAAMDPNGNIWVGCGDNISAINTKDNSIRNLRLTYVDEKVGNISSIKFDREENLWIGTTQLGLFKYNKDDSTFESFHAPQNLSSNSISSMIFDQDNFLWIATTNGINKFNPSDFSFTLYNKSDGLPSDQYSHDASINISPIFMSKNETIYTCSDTYLVSFDPRVLGTNSSFPKIVFPSYSIAGNKYSINSTDKQLNFTYRDKNITFDFFGINFIDPAKTQFEYKLEEYDDHWVKNRNKSTAFYSSLPIGKHLLHIRTTNKSGQFPLNDQETAIWIHVTGPFWKTPEFIFLCLCFCAAVFYSIYKIRLDQFKKIQSIRQKISRDLHDEIGSTLSTISINSLVAEKLAPDHKPELIPVLRSIGESARSATDNMSDIVWAISPNNDTFHDIMERIQIFAFSLLDSRNIKLQMDIPESLESIPLDMQQRKNIYLILREAIHNVAKYSQAKNCLIKGTVNQKMINLQVNDDGKGFDNVNSSLGGNGFINMQQRASELNAQFHIRSEKQKGTQVSLEFEFA